MTWRPRRSTRAFVLVPLAGALLAGPIPDRNHDGRIVVACLGDSNTGSGFPRDAKRRWCELAADTFAPAGWTFVNLGRWKTGVDTAPEVLAQLRDSADPPDAVIFAYGSNDLVAHVPTAEIVRRYETAVDLALGMGAIPFVALVPPLAQSGKPLNPLREELNVALRTYFPRMTLDFASAMTYPDDYEDWIHLNGSGQTKRARIVVEALLVWPPPS